MSNQVEQIRAEVERRNLANYCGTAEQYEEELFAILDTIEAEEKEHPIPEDIQEAADKYIGHPYEVDEGVEVSMRREAYAAGILAERERLMAGAIKTNVFDVEDGTDAAKLIVRIPGAKTGDEVYIIKEEGK